MYENIIADMKEEIRAVLAKNVLLNDEIARVNEIRTQEKLVNDTVKEDEFLLHEEISHILTQFESKKSKGKDYSNLGRSSFKSGIEIKDQIEQILKKNTTL